MASASVSMGLDIAVDVDESGLAGLTDDLDAAKKAANELDGEKVEVEADLDITKYRAALDTARDQVQDLQREFADKIVMNVDTTDTERNLKNAEGDVRAMTRIVKAESKKMDAAMSDIDGPDLSGRGGGRSFDSDMKKASANVEEFKDEAKQNFAETASSFNGSFESAGDLIRDTLGGVSANLAGPWAAAAGAAALGIGLMVGKLTEAEEKALEVADAAGQIGVELARSDAAGQAEALAGAFDEFAGQGLDLKWTTDASTAIEGMKAAADSGAVSLGEFYNAFTNTDPTVRLEQQKAAMAALDGGLDSLNTQMAANKLTNLDANDALHEQYAAMDALKGPLGDQIRETELAAIAQEGMEEALRASTTGAEKMEQKQSELNDAMSEAQGELDAAKDALSGYLDVLNGTQDAQLALDRGLADIRETADDASKSFDRNTTAGLDNQEMVIDNIQAINDLAVEQAASGETAEEVAGKHDKNTKALRDELVAAGYAEDQVDDLIETYGRTPDQVKTDVEASGTAQAIADMDEVERKALYLDGLSAAVKVQAAIDWDSVNAAKASIQASLTSGPGRVNIGAFSDTVGGGVSIPEDARPIPEQQSLNLVRVNIAGREVRAVVEQEVGYSRSSTETAELLGVGGRF